MKKLLTILGYVSFGLIIIFLPLFGIAILTLLIISTIVIFYLDKLAKDFLCAQRVNIRDMLRSRKQGEREVDVVINYKDCYLDYTQAVDNRYRSPSISFLAMKISIKRLKRTPSMTTEDFMKLVEDFKTDTNPEPSLDEQWRRL